MSEKNFKEVELTEQELQELNEIDVDELDEEPEDNADERNENPETETPKKEGKLKKIGKAVLRGVKWAAPKVGLFAAGYATKMAVGKFMKQPTVIDGTVKDIPSIPEIPAATETINLGEGVTAEVNNL